VLQEKDMQSSTFRFLLAALVSVPLFGCEPRPVVHDDDDAVDVEVGTGSEVPPPEKPATGVDVNVGGSGVDVDPNRDAGPAQPGSGVDVNVGGGKGVDVDVNKTNESNP
jgi:hypothetical protein